MMALDLFLLGRRLMKMGEVAMRGGPDKGPLPSVLLILHEVSANRDTTITDLARRTGLPQSYVSTSIAQLEAKRMIQTTANPNDRRSTLVRVSPLFKKRLGERGAVRADDVIAEALGPTDGREIADVIGRLEYLSQRLSERGKSASAAQRSKRGRRVSD